MIDSGCFEKGHLKQEAFILLEQNNGENEVRASIAKHLGSCNLCAERYADFLADEMLMDIPEDLNEAIFDKTINKEVKKSSNSYSFMQIFKLTAAAVLAITLYSTGVFNIFYKASDKLSNNFSYTEEFLQKNNMSISDKLNKGVLEFSDKINNIKGVGSNEKK